ncbi:MAG TPA: GNAT family N-acetyltransferase [Beijerinckiaceae bacterium]
MPATTSALVVVRPATRADLPAVQRLLRETWHDSYDALVGPEQVAAVSGAWHGPEALAHGLGRPRHLFLVADAADGLAGTISATLHDDALVVDRLYVRPPLQRRGVGRALLHAAGASLPAGTVRLNVHAENAKGRAFYEGAGFAWTGDSVEDGMGRALVYERRAKGTVGRGAEAVAIRPARDGDAQDLFGLLALCFAEYPGCYVDPHDDLADLRAPGRAFAEKGGAFFVAEDPSGRTCACVAVDYPEEGTGELHRLYVRPDMRRRGLGERLIRLVEEHAHERGARKVLFWSDTRFTAAHRLYERLGYVRLEGTRALGDISGSVEHRFEKAL